MYKTSLYEEHTQLNAKMVPFAGWEMPLSYTSITEEISAVRNQAGIFDVSHMGEFFITGKDALSFVNFIITNDIVNLPTNKAVYSPICNQLGMILDDVISYKLSNDKVLVCVNASNKEKIKHWILNLIKTYDCEFQDVSDETSLIALQGPKSKEVLNAYFKELDIQLEYYSAQEFTHQGQDFVISRTGYTGEHGYELFFPHKMAKDFWSFAIKNQVQACGLAARDMLRLEVCYPLYGNELNEDLTPLDTGLKWTVKMDKKDFMGKDAISQYRQQYALLKFSISKPFPRSGYEICNQNQEVIGTVTSGGFSPTLKQGICLAKITKDKILPDTEFFINIRNKQYALKRNKKAFYTGGAQE